MASRIIGRGDVVGLIQRFEDVVDEEKAERDAIRMLKGEFDMNDFLEQIDVLKKTEADDRELVRIGAMISSMTEDERRHPACFVVTSREELVEGGERKGQRGALYDMSRLARVARGSGREEQEVTDLLDRFAMMRQVLTKIGMSTGLLDV